MAQPIILLGLIFFGLHYGLTYGYIQDGLLNTIYRSLFGLLCCTTYLYFSLFGLFLLTLHINKTQFQELYMSKYIVYTYQFAPLQTTPNKLFGENDLLTPEQAMANKQETFSKLLAGKDLSFSFKNKIYGHKILLESMGVVVFRIANNRNTTLEKEFQKRKIEYTPSCCVIIDNRHDVQYIAIEEDATAFYETEQVVKILQSTFNKFLKPYGLRLSIQKLYQKTEFWTIVNTHKDKIELVRFHFSYPNLPRVNKTVKEIIASTSKSTNSKQSSFELKSATGETLQLNEDNQELMDLANYAADSGDEIDIKAKGVRSFIKTGSTTVSFEIEDIDAIISKDIFQDGVEKLIVILNKVTKS